jgi:hypothetical protein
VSYARLAKKHQVSIAALGRHRRGGHLPSALVDKATALALTGQEVSLAALRRDESEGLLGHLVNQRQRLYAMLDSAEAEDIKLALGVHGRLTDSLRLLALEPLGGQAAANRANRCAPSSKDQEVGISEGTPIHPAPRQRTDDRRVRNASKCFGRDNLRPTTE